MSSKNFPLKQKALSLPYCCLWILYVYFERVPKKHHCHWSWIVFWVREQSGSHVPICGAIQNTDSDVSQTKSKAIIKLCFSDGKIANKWGNETAGYEPLIIDSAGPHGIDFQSRGLLQSSDSSLDYVILSIVSTFCAYHLSYKNNFPLHGLFFLYGTFWIPDFFNLPFGFP